MRIAGLATIALAVAGVALTFLADSQVHGSVVARPLSWLAPLIAACAVVGVSWLLLAQRGTRDEGDATVDRTRCSACEREVMGGWRMCPYCGAMLGSSTA